MMTQTKSSQLMNCITNFVKSVFRLAILIISTTEYFFVLLSKELDRMRSTKGNQNHQMKDQKELFQERVNYTRWIIKLRLDQKISCWCLNFSFVQLSSFFLFLWERKPSSLSTHRSHKRAYRLDSSIFIFL